METKEIVVPDSLSLIAKMIAKDWQKQGRGVSVHAAPYLSAMRELNLISDKYFYDSGASIVAYFLSNATSWKGEVAKAVKLKLNKMLKDSYK